MASAKSIAQLSKLLINCFTARNYSIISSHLSGHSSHVAGKAKRSLLFNDVSKLSFSNQPIWQYPILFQYNQYTLNGFSSRNSLSTMTSSANYETNYFKNFQNRVLQNPLQKSTVNPRRSVIQIGYDGKKHSEKAVIDRFRRLGNGMWLRKQIGYNEHIWEKFYKRRKAFRVFRGYKTLICNKQQSKMLDKMVANDVKTQKWYVDDPYKGYTEEAHFYYHPKDLPGNTLKKPDDYHKYAVRRYNITNRLRRNRRHEHPGIITSYRQKPITKKATYFWFAP